MKLKYYLRGAGIGIVAATVVLSAAFLFQDDISDAQIIQRALELGMVMEEGAPKTLADVSQQDPEKADLKTDTDDGNSGVNGDDEDDPGNQPDTDADDDQKPADEANTPDDTPGQDSEDDPDQPEKSKPDQKKDDNKDEENSGGSQDSGNTVTVTIVGGDVSRTVSAKVFEAGLVDSADEFNAFLGANDYDNLLQPGTYKIEKGSSFEQIAQILTAR